MLPLHIKFRDNFQFSTQPTQVKNNVLNCLHLITIKSDALASQLLQVGRTQLFCLQWQISCPRVTSFKVQSDDHPVINSVANSSELLMPRNKRDNAFKFLTGQPQQQQLVNVDMLKVGAIVEYSSLEKLLLGLYCRLLIEYVVDRGMDK